MEYIGPITTALKALDAIKKRVDEYRKGPKTFEILSENFDRLDIHFKEVGKLLETFPKVVPPEMSRIFDETLESVSKNLESCDKVMEGVFSSAFAGSSRFTDRITSHSTRLFRADKLRMELIATEAKINHSSNMLLHLAMGITNALKIQKHHDKLLVALESSARVSVTDEFRRPTTSRTLSSAVFLDFDDPSTPEGDLMQSVLPSDSSSTVTATAGVMACAIVGMPGVGKTVALQGLASHKKVYDHFSHGILFMTLGQSATLQTVLEEVKKLVALTGGRTIVAEVAASTLLRHAVDYAASWFVQKKCLLVIDDVWSIEFFEDLREIFRESPESRIVVSTRSIVIAQHAKECGARIVPFKARTTLGSVSENIFMRRVRSGVFKTDVPTQEGAQQRCVRKVLFECRGLPMALAAAGGAVARLSNIYGDFQDACDEFSEKLKNKKVSLGDESTEDGRTLNACILLSLEFLQAEFSKRKRKRSLRDVQSIRDLYTSLCVLQNQAWVPVSVLRRLWQLEEDDAKDAVSLFIEMSLANPHTRSGNSKEFGIVLHDLHLEFCRQQAEQSKKTSLFHTRLLSGYFQASNHTRADESSAHLPRTILRCTPRPWWDVPQDGYIHWNLSRHLLSAGQGIELAALLLEGRWTKRRGQIGGILALKIDFEQLEEFFVRITQQRVLDASEVRPWFQQIFKAVQLSWGRMARGLRCFQFHLWGLLLSSRASSGILDAYMRSVEKCTPPPYLRPLNSFFPGLDSALIMDIPVGGECDCVVCSPCGRFIAAASGESIVITKSNDPRILRRMQGHTGRVTSIAFIAGSKKLVSGSTDGELMVWEWEQSETAVQVLKGHGDEVTCVTVSGDGRRIFSSSENGILRIWDVSTGENSELPFGSNASCAAVCGEGRMIALGFYDGSLKVIDRDTNKVLVDDAHDGRVSCASFSRSSVGDVFLAAGSGNCTIRMWNTRTGARVGEPFEGHKSLVHSVSFRPDRNQIVSCSCDGRMRLWDVSTGECVGISSKSVTWLRGATFTGNGERIVSGSGDGIVRIWDARLFAKAENHSPGHSGWVLGVAISQDGFQVASASSDKTVRLWDVLTGQQVGAPLEGHTKEVRGVSFTPDGQWVVSSSWEDNHQDAETRIWNASTREQIGEPLLGHTQPLCCVSESKDGCYIVSHDTCGRTIIWNRGDSAMVWKSEKIESDSESNVTEGQSDSDVVVPGDGSAFENKITADEAEKIIDGWGQQTAHRCPKCCPEFNAELYIEVKESSVYSDLVRRKTLLAEKLGVRWAYNAECKIFAAGLASGSVAICKLISK